jgi:protein required for attachment to host cells
LRGLPQQRKLNAGPIEGEVAMSKFRILVADQAEAIFYDSPSLTAAPKEVARISDPTAHMHDRDLGSERPGRSYESVGSARHSIAREGDSRHHQMALFARRIARRLDDARRKGEFEQLIVVAGPAFLGLVREELSRPTRALVAHEIHKDLVHSPAGELRKHLSATEEEVATV